MSSISFTEGVLVLVESDKKGEWWNALPWQSTEFVNAIKLGTMKTMGGCYSDTTEYTNEFEQDGMLYRFIIKNYWGPCWIENITTKKKREVKYFEIGNILDKSLTNVKTKISECKIVK